MMVFKILFIFRAPVDRAGRLVRQELWRELIIWRQGSL